MARICIGKLLLSLNIYIVASEQKIGGGRKVLDAGLAVTNSGVDPFRRALS